MAWNVTAIKLAPARFIFVGVNIEEVKLDDRVVGYRASWRGESFENRSLTRLCRRLWCQASGEEANEDAD